jgi:NarL family two-component system response regulator YdfI
MTRSGLQELLRGDPRFEVVGVGSTLSALESGALGRRPDVVLMDAPETQAALSRSLFAENPPIVLLANDLNRSQLRTVLRRGVRAIVSRHSSQREIAAALEATVAGLTVLSAEQMDALLPASRNPFEAAEGSAEPLTSREAEVLGLLAEGAGNKEIANRLKLSEHTVKFHVSSILGKLGAATRTEAVARGVQHGLVVI